MVVVFFRFRGREDFLSCLKSMAHVSGHGFRCLGDRLAGRRSNASTRGGGVTFRHRRVDLVNIAATIRSDSVGIVFIQTFQFFFFLVPTHSSRWTFWVVSQLAVLLVHPTCLALWIGRRGRVWHITVEDS